MSEAITLRARAAAFGPNCRLSTSPRIDWRILAVGLVVEILDNSIERRPHCCKVQTKHRAASIPLEFPLHVTDH